MSDPISDSDGPARVTKDLDFEREALPHLDAVCRFARSLTRNESDADDVLQETFLRAYRSWDTYQLGSDCRRWLFSICHHTFLRIHKQTARRAARELGDADALPAVLLHAQSIRDGTDDVLTRLQLAPAIGRALSMLTEPFRVVIVLVDGNGYTYEEVAELLSIPVGTVRSRLFRARRLLQESLFAQAQDFGLGRDRSSVRGLDA